MSACLLAGALTLALGADAAFSLEWTHSVEQTRWHEEWRVVAGALVLTRAAVKGSGAGMEPGEGARLENGWWVWEPTAAPVDELILAASGLTPSAWRLCTPAGCVALGARSSDPLLLRPCPE
ncbi:DUF1850 domain-containing protein [Rhodobacter maris]|uniref:Uncharacterized protein DUF1850 n=1 Tax=Rhodobacter maris TaxID=446682 RepID=A0A285SVY5_9RHOB|nr:DUF1850 domain-containing protein [Rhodobacter maris]SOC12783.1 uncharacterized protein DUF1850 [Rhodobacter maris]